MQGDVHTMSVKTLLATFDIQAPDIEITDLVLDSREVAIHKAFVAVKGHDLDGRDFIPQAISLGAKVILAESCDELCHGEVEMREQSIIIHFYQLNQKLSALAEQFYHRPAEKLDLVAVTGTNGKTSTVQLITQLRHLLGDVCASIGTLGSGVYQPDSILSSSKNTTPDAIQMQRLIAQFQQLGATQVAIEASSHALVQGRISHVHCKIAVFTNLTRDHLDYHGSMSEYAAAKRLLLGQPGLQFLVVNIDDPESDAWLQQVAEDVEVVVCSTSLEIVVNALSSKYCVATSINYSSNGCAISIDSSWGKADIHCALLGRFNVANLLAALSVQLLNGFSLQQLAPLTEQLTPVDGRMEIFSNSNGANIVVDFAHTPDALEQTLLACRNHCHGRLVCIFGCGGDRDQGKRSLMGSIAEQHADSIIVTNDNSRSEDPEQICKQILSGCRAPEAIQIELDRKRAIQLALSQTQHNDLILVAGKGHENTQVIGQKSLEYNERAYVKNLLKGNGQ
jgi:UDP-N-acetylmuramoyl-L-alanyl-D-glutamate--2,6-diaminopimelate ligase